MDLLNKIAVVTGAGSGIGRASSLKLASNGAKVVVVDFNKETGEETVSLIKEQGGEGIFVQADVSKVKTFRNMSMRLLIRMDALIYFSIMLGLFRKFLH